MIGLQLHQKLPWPKTLTWSGTDGRTNRRTNERTDERTTRRTHRPENIMPLYYRRWGIKMQLPVPRQEYDSCCPFVWCVLSFDFAIWLGTFRFEFSPEFSIFVILLYTFCTYKSDDNSTLIGQFNLNYE